MSWSGDVSLGNRVATDKGAAFDLLVESFETVVGP